MDVLSVGASSVAVIQAINFIITSLYEFAKGVKDADDRVEGLCKELNHLMDLIDTVEKTLNRCRPFDLDLVDDDLLRQCDVIVGDCYITLTGLRFLVEKIKGPVKQKARRFTWRVRVAVDLNVHGRDLNAFRDKIHKSNLALQTMLQTLTVCLCVNQRNSQKTILLEVEKLSCAIEDALKASQNRAGAITYNGNDHSDARLARNLHNIVQAATHVRSAASTRAGSNASTTDPTNHEDFIRRRSSSVQDIGPSMAGGLTDDGRRRVEAYIQTTGQYRPQFCATIRTMESRTMSLRNTSSASEVPLKASLAELDAIVPGQTSTMERNARVRDVKNQCDDEDEDLEIDDRELLESLRDLARDRLIYRDFPKATQFLKQALERKAACPSADDVEAREIEVQLALCHFFQGEWRKAAPIIEGLAKRDGLLDGPTCNLLHALSLAQLRDPEYFLDNALRSCRKAMLAKEKLLKSALDSTDGYLQQDYSQSVGLCATIYRMRNDPIRYNIFQKKLPVAYKYQHPASELDYIIKHPQLLRMILGDDTPDFLLGTCTTPETVCELDAGTTRMGPGFGRRTTVRFRRSNSAIFPLRDTFDLFEREERDTEKEAYCGPSRCQPSKLEPIDETSESEVLSIQPIARHPRTRSMRRRLRDIFFIKRMYRDNQIENGESELGITEPDSSLISITESYVARSSQERGLRELLGLKKSKKLIERLKSSNILWKGTRRCSGTTYSITDEDQGQRILSWMRGQPVDAIARAPTVDDVSDTESIATSVETPCMCDYFGPTTDTSFPGRGLSMAPTTRCMKARHRWPHPHQQHLLARKFIHHGIVELMDTSTSFFLQNSEDIPPSAPTDGQAPSWPALGGYCPLSELWTDHFNPDATTVPYNTPNWGPKTMHAVPRQPTRQGSGLPSIRESIAGRFELHSTDVPVRGGRLGGQVDMRAPKAVGTVSFLGISTVDPTLTVSPTVSRDSSNLRTTVSSTVIGGATRIGAVKQLPIISEVPTKVALDRVQPNSSAPSLRPASEIPVTIGPGIKARTRPTLIIRTQAAACYDGLMDELARVFSALNGADSESLTALRLQLEVLLLHFGHLEPFHRDPVLGHDVRRVLASLNLADGSKSYSKGPDGWQIQDTDSATTEGGQHRRRSYPAGAASCKHEGRPKLIVEIPSAKYDYPPRLKSPGNDIHGTFCRIPTDESSLHADDCQHGTAHSMNVELSRACETAPGNSIHTEIFETDPKGDSTVRGLQILEAISGRAALVSEPRRWACCLGSENIGQKAIAAEFRDSLDLKYKATKVDASLAPNSVESILPQRRKSNESLLPEHPPATSRPFSFAKGDDFNFSSRSTSHLDTSEEPCFYPGPLPCRQEIISGSPARHSAVSRSIGHIHTYAATAQHADPRGFNLLLVQ